MMRSVRVLSVVVLLMCVPSGVLGQTLVWDANVETDIAGYRVSYGTESGKYTNEVDVGKQTQYQPPQGFDWSRTLYFAVRAYNTSGLISPYSAEVRWTPPVATVVTKLQANVSYPLLAGVPVTWTATATSASTLEYRFWLYRKTAWTMLRDYAPGNTVTWTPTGLDIGEPYRVQVWARAVGSSVDYESYLGTPTFAVTGVPFELSADVDFPTPPGNEVTWTARVAGTATGPLEYKFLVLNQSTNTWTVFRDYAANNTALWTPTATGTYSVQALARTVGSTAQYEHIATTDPFQVSQSPLTVTSLTVDTSSPTTTGTKVTWTARVRGGMQGPIQYQFWLYTPATGWKLGQPYSSSRTFAWTPTWADIGDFSVQVWAKSNGSTAAYEAYRSSTSPLKVERAALSLTTQTLFPVAPGSYVDWMASVADPSANLEYQYWVYSAATASWSVARAYSADPAFRWIPATTGTFAIQVYGRQAGSSATYEAAKGTDFLEVTQGPAQLVSLTSNVSFPAAPGTAITWTAAAKGGTAGPLQYQFWRYSGGRWIKAQDYSPLNTYSWTPTSADIGEHALQVWVKSNGSTAAYESYKSTGTFAIK